MLVAFAAVLVMPFYVGLVHWSALRFFAYAVVAAAAMSLGEYVESPARTRGGLRLFLQEAFIWFLTIAVAGGAAYLLAWLF